MKRRRIVIYNDAPAFGGHEVMSVELAREIAKTHEVFYFFANSKLGRVLEPPVHKTSLPFQSSIGPLAIRKNLNLRHIRWLSKQFRSVGANLVLIVQGAIDLCLRGTLAAVLNRMPVVSYIPMAFSRSHMGLPAGFFFDRYAAAFYRLFDAFITIDLIQRDHILAFTRSDTPVFVLENCVSFADRRSKERPDKAKHSLRLGFVGRLEWRQKGLRAMVEVAGALKARKQDFRFVVVGEGDDRQRLERLIKDMGVEDRFDFLGWVSNRNAIFDAFDILLLPSLFEGVPMVMLEALMRSVPVLAHLTPGTAVFAEYLPAFCLYRDNLEAVERLADPEKFIAHFEKECDGIRTRVQNKHGKDRFAERVAPILLSLIGPA